MEFLRAGQVGVGGQDKRQQIPEFGEAVPGVSRRESLFAQLAGRREKLTGDLPQENASRRAGDEVERDLAGSG